jgi:hypothetical protein
MLSSDDHPGLFTITAGIILLVFTGVGLSLLSDKRSSSGKGKEAAKREIRLAGEEIARMKEDRKVLEQHFQNLSRKSTAAKASFTRVSAELKEQQGRLEELTSKLANLRQEVPRIESEFDDYRANHRNQLWTSAAGQSLGILRTRDGKLYRQAVIRRVTSTSLDITCDTGPVNISIANLEQPLLERFQWTENEIGNARRSARDQPSPLTAPVPPKPATPPPPPPAVANREELVKARTAVRLRIDRTQTLENQLSEARNAVASGKRSIPGSLETWQARAERLQLAVTRSRADLAAAKADLALLDPADPLAR